MISFKHRFHGRNTIKTTYTKGKLVKNEGIGLKYSLNPKRNQYRAAVVVSKKVHKSAVKRNRIRRRIYEIIRQNQDQLNGGYDLIFSVYNDSVAEIPAKDLEEQITKLIKQIS